MTSSLNENDEKYLGINNRDYLRSLSNWDGTTAIAIGSLLLVGFLGLRRWGKARIILADPETIRKRRLERLDRARAAAMRQKQQAGSCSEGGSPATALKTAVSQAEAEEETKKSPRPDGGIRGMEKAGKEPASGTKHEEDDQGQNHPLRFQTADDESPTKKKSKKRKHPPPIQMVCEAVLEATGSRLRVEDHPESKTWGGVGWWKDASPSPLSPRSEQSKTILRLKLYPYYEPSKENDWEYVCECVSKCLGLISNDEDNDGIAVNILPSDLRPAVACFDRLHRLSEWGHAPFLVPAVVEGDNFWPFADLCKTMQSRIVQTISKLIEAGAIYDDDSDDEDGDGIFSEDYDRTPFLRPTKTKTVSPWDEFMDLLCRGEVSIGLLRSIETESSPGLARRIAERLLRDLEEWLSVSNTKCVQTMLTWFQPLSQFPAFFAPVITWSMREKEILALRDESTTGRQVEARKVLLTPLARAAAMCLHASDRLPNPRIVSELKTVPKFPFSVYSHPPDREIDARLKLIEDQCLAARSSLVPLVNAALKEDKELVFEWVRLIVAKNKSLATMAKSDLLDADPSGVLSESFTISFLLGLTSAFSDLCCRRLMDRHDKVGAIQAFDAAYLLDDVKWSIMFEGESHSMLSTAAGNVSNLNSSSLVDNQIQGIVKKYSGSTDFFFLLTALLRVALYPALKIEHEQYWDNSDRGIINMIREQANAKASEEQIQLPKPLLTKASHEVCMNLGWQVQLSERHFVTNITNFALLQLKWVLAQCKVTGARNRVNIIPDWIAKDPAKWLAHVSRSPHLLTQRHAETAIEIATELLEAGRLLRFSPIVMTSLLSIASSFVHAGVSQAWKRQRGRRNGRWGRRGGLAFDSRDQSIYLSFDKNDLGVTVFTNRLVCTQLCPTLIRTFIAIDVVEGLDMDREHDFTKLGAKSKITDLILRLWSHPNGECRQSIITGLSPQELQSFVSSLMTALSMNFDDAVIKLSTVASTIRANKTQGLSRYDKAFIEQHSDGAVSELLTSRRYLMLLCTLSAEPSIASSFGGNGKTKGASGGNTPVCDLANMIVHFIDIITDQHGGGISADLELKLSEYTQAMLKRGELVSKYQRSQQFCKEEMGLDVSVVCHQLLALAASWHAAGKLKRNSRSSPLLEALVSHDDIDVQRWSHIFNKLEISARNGYRDGFQVQTSAIESDSGDQRRKRRIQNSKRDQMTHEEIDKLFEFHNIRVFIDDLSGLLESSKRSNASIEPDVIENLQYRILKSEGRSIDDEDYGQDLSDYVISSYAFSSPGDTGTFLHYYDRNARSRLSLQTGNKRLIKEARKCYKNLPVPHSNSSCFVCFAEERMDLCRAIITGPVDTPYAHGLFQFDIYFPQTYPDVPPLVTFMTTGGGQVRFSVNLYNDGKVCLSLLGLTFAGDESQRWNPQKSSLAQVLLSMQTQIFGVKEPFFNEGSGVPLRMRNTPVGRERSRKFNADIRLATLRHAVVSHLRTPPVGFEEVTKRHFSMCRKRIIMQARRWMIEEENNSSVFRRFESVYGELVQLLVPLTCYDGGKSLLPRKEDAAFVEDKDRSFRMETGNDDSTTSDKSPALSSIDGSDKKPSPRAANSPDAPAFNPWASPPQRGESNSGGTAEGTVEEDSDDDLYI